MRKPNLVYRPALAGLVKAGRFGSQSGSAGVVVKEIQGFAAASIIASQDQAIATTAAVSKYFAMPVTDLPRRVVHGGLSTSGVAPGQWLAIERDPSKSSISALRADLADFAAVVDQSDSRLVLEVSGPLARLALAKGIPVDLDASVFKPGDVAQTIAAHISVQISLMTERPAFELVSAASTAGSLWSWLSASAGEYGLDVV